MGGQLHLIVLHASNYTSVFISYVGLANLFYEFPLASEVTLKGVGNIDQSMWCYIAFVIQQISLVCKVGYSKGDDYQFRNTPLPL